MEESRLFEDIQTVAEMSKELAVTEQPSTPDVAAIEQGRRTRPDGTTEDYQRVEFHKE